MTVHLKANNGWNWKSDYVPMYNLVNAYLADGGDRAQITVTGIPWMEPMPAITARSSPQNRSPWNSVNSLNMFRM